DKSIPEAIRILVKCGRSPPLSLFLPEILERIRYGVNIKYVKLGTGSNANTRILDVTEFPDEGELRQDQWTVAYNAFLNFISVIAGSQIQAGFYTHYDSMLSDKFFTYFFAAYRSFDRDIRARFFTQPYIIDPTDSKYLSQLQDAKTINNRESHPSVRYKPYEVSHPGRSTSFRAQTMATSSSYPPLCLRCGAKDGHQAATCAANVPSRQGCSFVIFTRGKYINRLSDKQPVCIRFNLGICSSSNGDRHALHICSLCGDTHHGATSCTRN
ncbi:hypothetical protein FPV67DRAFT_1395692, partial [Lyophyllum atratum]